MTGGRSSTGTAPEPTALRDRIGTARRVLFRGLFGTREGAVVFLVTLCFVGAYWRVGVFITDNYTLANALASLADGHLAIREATFGPLASPGTVVHDGRVYGRNYGHVVAALPVLWALEGLATVADPGVLFAALWSLLVVALGRTAGLAVGRPTAGALAGAVCGLGAFAANAAVARPLSAHLFPLAALAIVGMVAAALAATTLYRLVARLHGRRPGVAAGGAAALATPLGFWASIPKRHVTVMALALGVAYALARSRETGDAPLSPTGFRSLAYALVGLAAWVHAGEAFVLFLALVAVDVPTAPANDRRTLAAVAGVFALSLVPFFVTNWLLSGNPVRPPGLLPRYDHYLASDGATAPGGGSGAGSGDSAVGAGGVEFALPGPLGTAFETGWLFVEPFVAGARAAVREPGTLYRTFVRGGYIPAVSERDADQAIYLTVLESAPLTAGVLAVAGTALARVRRWLAAGRHVRPVLDAARTRWSSVRTAATSPATATDAFVALVALGFFLIYLPRLPVFAQVTVRYYLLLYPLAVYGIVRQRAWRRVLSDHGRAALWAWVGGVMLGGQLLLVAVALGSLGRGEAFQLHALLGLAAGALLAVLALATVVTDRFDRAAAVAAGVAAALGTDFLLLSGLVYFRYGQYALPAADALSRILARA